jgi:radical SAM superfamily enzyme YgiQ (UPF0313 family)
MANFVIINPPQVYVFTQISSASVPPIGAAYIAAYARKKGHDVQIIDAFGESMNHFYSHGIFHLRGLNFEEIIGRIPKKVDIIGITNLFSHAFPAVRDLAKRIKELFPAVPILTGGIHPTALPEFVLQQSPIDYVVLGEGEQTTINLIETLESGRTITDIDGIAYRQNVTIKHNKKTQLIENLDTLPFPAYDLLPIENYIKAKNPHGAARGRWLPMIATRGCPYECTFCTAPSMWLPEWRNRSFQNVTDEMEYWIQKYRIEDFHFEDLAITLKKGWIGNFCDEIIRRGINVSWQMPNGTRSENVDDEIVAKLKAAGCTNITLAPESGSARVLEKMKKTVNLETIISAFRRSVKARMTTCAFFVIGTPYDDVATTKETFKLIRQLAWIGLNEISITTFTALPGCELFSKLYKEGKVQLTDEFFKELLYMADLAKAISWTKHISDKQLKHFRNWGYIQFFFLSFFFRPWRLLRSLWNIIFGVQENKLERVGYEKLHSTIALFRNLIAR